MKVLTDTNVVLDVLLKRPGLYAESFAIFQMVEQRRIIGCISSSAMTDIFYLLNKAWKDIDAVYQIVENMSSIFTIVPVFESTIKSALPLHWKDFEDAVQYITAKENNAQYIITRNKDDYEKTDISCISPADFAASFTHQI
jgi:predicted nucleic acid-binding protein